VFAPAVCAVEVWEAVSVEEAGGEGEKEWVEEGVSAVVKEKFLGIQRG
jgi:hypothetical protein